MSLGNLCKRYPLVLQKFTFSKMRVSGDARAVPVRSPIAKLPRPDMSVKNKKDIDGMGWFLLLVPITTFGLGTWQVRRKKWKEHLIEGLVVKTKQPPIPFPENEDDLANLEFRKISVKGKFDHSQEMFLGPRSCLIEGESTYHGKLMSSTPNGSSGYLVVTPFVLSDTNEKILVNRGWIPFTRKKVSTRREGQIEGEVELVGIVRFTEPKPSFTPLNKPDVRVWFVRDVERMAESIGCKPIFLDATVESTIHGGPIGGQTRASLRNDHFSYILTWFGLSFATAFMWYSRYLK